MTLTTNPLWIRRQWSPRRRRTTPPTARPVAGETRFTSQAWPPMLYLPHRCHGHGQLTWKMFFSHLLFFYQYMYIYFLWPLLWVRQATESTFIVLNVLWRSLTAIFIFFKYDNVYVQEMERHHLEQLQQQQEQQQRLEQQQLEYQLQLMQLQQQHQQLPSHQVHTSPASIWPPEMFGPTHVARMLNISFLF